MLYLINENWFFLVAAAFFAAFAGWALLAMRSVNALSTLEQERNRLMHDLVALSAGDDTLTRERENEVEMMRRRSELEIARAAELERALVATRQESGDAVRRLAELEAVSGDLDRVTGERDMLLSRVDELEQDLARLNEAAAVTAAPVVDEDASLKAWRLRYFEQRVRYLESLPPPEPVMLAAEPLPPVEPEVVVETKADFATQWNALYYAARTRDLEAERAEAPMAAPQPLVSATPNEEDVEAQRRAGWRERYFVKRTAYLQSLVDEAGASLRELSAALAAKSDEALEANNAKTILQTALNAANAERETAITAKSESDTEIERLRAELASKQPTHDWELEAQRTKWRNRYLEARLRHLEAIAARPMQVVAPPVEQAPEPAPEVKVEPAPLPAMEVVRQEEEAAPPQPRLAPLVKNARPTALPAARHGAPDDLTLIDGVSPRKQITLNSLGVYHFDQIAAWSDANVSWVDNYLRLRGQIADEDWVGQAAELARGVGVALRDRLLEAEEA